MSVGNTGWIFLKKLQFCLMKPTKKKEATTTFVQRLSVHINPTQNQDPDHFFGKRKK